MAYERRSSAGWAVHPGEILREEFLKPLRLTSYRLAKQMRVPVPRVHDIVLEKRGITADTAVRLARVLGTSDQFWMNLQSAYELFQARTRQARHLEKIRPLRRGVA